MPPRPFVRVFPPPAPSPATPPAAYVPRKGWTRCDTVWSYPDNPYRVLVSAPLRQWNAATAPFRVVDAAGTVLGGSNLLAKAQEMAEILGDEGHPSKKEKKEGDSPVED